MKKYLLLAMLCPIAGAFAQVPEDAVRYSWYPQNGTARNRAIGGAMGSLGGDLTALYVNPAGLGFYKTREFVITPGIHLNKLKADTGIGLPPRRITVLHLAYRNYHWQH